MPMVFDNVWHKNYSSNENNVVCVTSYSHGGEIILQVGNKQPSLSIEKYKCSSKFSIRPVGNSSLYK